MSTRVMLVDDRVERARWLQDALDQAGYTVVATVQGMDDLYQLVESTEPDVVIVEANSAKRDTLEHLGASGHSYPKPIVMLSEHHNPAMLQTAMQAGISAYVVQGLSPDGVRSIVQVAIAQFEQYQDLHRQLTRAETRLQEQKLVERAKGLLMERHGLPEQEAYGVLRKAAMDHSKRLVDIARHVLKRYG
jgi:two-component system, response regulator / RNA-binding antiterminator